MSPYISANTGDGEEKVISQGKCISYLVALLEEACHASNCILSETAYQDVLNLTTYSRVLNHGTVHCAQCLISREQLYVYTIGLLFVLACYII